MPTPAPRLVSLFDASKHMRVAEVKPGMKGYGLSVFMGTKIERFDVEVVSVLHNFNPQYDVVLIRCSGQNLEHTGPVAGMSGSPVYLTDEQGRSRLIGAFAYGWSLMKDPVAGVQPIEYMLEIGSTLKPEPAATQQASQGTNATPASATKLTRFDPLKRRTNLNSRDSSDNTPQGANPLLGDRAMQLQPLATPLMTAGLSAKMLQTLAPRLREFGFVALQAGSSGTDPAASTQPSEIVPGSVMGAPLLTGDVDMTAIGTCTEVIGDRIFGFGHPFNNEGPITLPMGSGKINGIIATLSQSFKIGSITEIKGALIADQSVGVAGKLGRSPPMIPIDLHVTYTDGSLDTTYHFNAAAHPRLTPLLSAAAVQRALSGRRDLPQYHTVSYDLSLQFANGKTVQLNDIAVNTADMALSDEVQTIVEVAAENPYERVALRKIEGTVRVTSEAQEADVVSVNLAKTKFRPGETLRAFVRYRPFRQGESVLPIELPLPHDLKDGTYQLSVSDRISYLTQEQATRPFRFDYQSADELFAMLKDLEKVQADALYVRLMRQADGIAVGRTALPKLPSSRRQVLLNSGRSDVTAFVSTLVKVIPTGVVMHGSADFQIEISSEDHVEVGGAHSVKPSEQRPPAIAPQESGRGGVRPSPIPPTPPRSEPPTPPDTP